MSYEDDINDDDDGGMVIHELCGSPAEFLGNLGNMASFRCRGCGMVFQRRMEAEPMPLSNGWIGSK